MICAATSGDTALPGAITVTRKMPSSTAAVVVTRNHSSVRPPRLPSFCTLPSPATPRNSELNTIGTTTMNSMLRNRSPNGLTTPSAMPSSVFHASVLSPPSGGA